MTNTIVTRSRGRIVTLTGGGTKVQVNVVKCQLTVNDLFLTGPEDYPEAAELRRSCRKAAAPVVNGFRRPQPLRPLLGAAETCFRTVAE